MIPYFSFTEVATGLLTIKVWGLMAVLGFLVALFLSFREAKRKNINKEEIWDVMILALIGMFVGGRIMYALFNFEKFEDLGKTIAAESGFSLLGGIILSAALVYIYAKIKKINIWKLADVLIPGAVASIIIIRIGCFLVYDHIGKLTSLPWGRIYLDGSIRHPVALYLVINALVIFIIIWYLRKERLENGILFFTFVAYYSVSRFLLDFTRCYDTAVCNYYYAGLTFTQWILLVIAPMVIYLGIKKANLKIFNHFNF
jgi:phosphatidylglycerol:prolipoprotein diacylglycerol transferase